MAQTFLEAPRLHVGDAQIVVDLGVIRLAGDREFVRLDRRLDLVIVLERVAEITEHARAVGVESKGAFVILDRIRVTTLHAHDDAQGVERLGKRRSTGNRARRAFEHGHDATEHDLGIEIALGLVVLQADLECLRDFPARRGSGGLRRCRSPRGRRLCDRRGLGYLSPRWTLKRRPPRRRTLRHRTTLASARRLGRSRSRRDAAGFSILGHGSMFQIRPPGTRQAFENYR